MSRSKSIESLKKMSIIELNDTLNRESMLLKNNKVIDGLPDKGESIKNFLVNIEKEIKYRKELKEIEESLIKLSISEKEKHVQKLCEIEKVPERERYKPFSTLNKVKEVNPDSKIFKIMEDCTPCNKPTKLILLPESIDILQKQDDRVKDEQLRVRHNRILDKLAEYEQNQDGDSETDDSTEQYSDHEGEDLS